MTSYQSPKAADIWLIGAGNMAFEYTRVLEGLSKDFLIVGRGASSASELTKKTGHNVIQGGIELALANREPPHQVIIATDVASLPSILKSCLESGVNQIMIEKPGGLFVEELQELNQLGDKVGAKIWVGYNRRFFESVLEAQKIIDQDGGLSSLSFEFTEWSHVISQLDKNRSELERWVLSNSSHVLDLAFYFGGKPEEMRCFHAGNLGWHSSSVFAGSGKTEKGILFSYLADWDAPGRWGVELNTKYHRLILRPMEKLQYTKKGEVNLIEYNLPGDIDRHYKPGLFAQTQNFLMGNHSGLCSLAEQILNIEVYCKIAGYQGKE